MWVTGYKGTLGSRILENWSNTRPWTARLEDRFYETSWAFSPRDILFLCAGTRGYAQCEGNQKAFRADVDGNIALAKFALRRGAFVVFVSTDGVEWGAHTAYARNRLLVEMALIMQPNVAIVRPGKFAADTVQTLAELCVKVGAERREGLHYWGDRTNRGTSNGA